MVDLDGLAPVGHFEQGVAPMMESNSVHMEPPIEGLDHGEAVAWLRQAIQGEEGSLASMDSMVVEIGGDTQTEGGY